MCRNSDIVYACNTYFFKDTLGRFSSIFDKGDKFCDFLYAFLYSNPLLKGVYSKRKEFAPKGSKFFPFRVDLISEGRKNTFDRFIFLEGVSVPFNNEN